MLINLREIKRPMVENTLRFIAFIMRWVSACYSNLAKFPQSANIYLIEKSKPSVKGNDSNVISFRVRREKNIKSPRRFTSKELF